MPTPRDNAADSDEKPSAQTEGDKTEALKPVSEAGTADAGEAAGETANTVE